MVVPRPQPFRYNLLKWRGLYFTEYNCFELANVRHRNLFYDKLSAILFYVSRGEGNQIGFNVFMLIAAVFIAWGRGKKYPVDLPNRPFK